MELPVSPLCDVEPCGRCGFVGTDVLLNTKLQAIKKTDPKVRFHFISGGAGGIRTRGGFNPTHAFQACDLNRSSTAPEPRIL